MPSSSKLRGKVCAYCAGRPATTWDHMFARSFFPKHDGFRENIPQVPSCAECNARKSAWESLIGVMYQFARDSLSSKVISVSDKIERDLQINKKLAHEMKEGLFTRETVSQSGIYYQHSGFRLSDEMVETISLWNESVAKAFYYFWKNENVRKDWMCIVMNPAAHGMHEFLTSMIEKSPESYSIENIDSGWKVIGAESPDQVILIGTEFNSIIQYVAILKERYMPLAETLKAFAY
ncbi:hypothetical protein E7T09_14155 [Deinococcus sp. KSM4-11]|uniref:hypothetical protein n=1 Tax=Deinococcus sp. KSM4-11 TaxID=2568654 RepID=UPI0010A3A865|nr:hypothetical protein [Deinococcus sp. KSM4-11]THF85687.1 hypothetical protein E7T09_14155 [Deinococcus sp. KSM4-11]